MKRKKDPLGFLIVFKSLTTVSITVWRSEFLIISAKGDSVEAGGRQSLVMVDAFKELAGQSFRKGI